MADLLTPDQFDALAPTRGAVAPPPAAAPTGLLSPDQFDALKPAPPTAEPTLAHEAGTAIYNGLGSILSTPRMVEHTKNWLEAQAGNAVTGDNKTGADLDANDPAMNYLPDQNTIYKLTGTHPTTAPTAAGQLAQNAVSGAVGAVADPLSGAGTFLKMAKQAAPGAAAGIGATIGQNIDPDSPLAPVLGGIAGALGYHGVTGAVGAANTAGRPYIPFATGAATHAADTAAGADLAGMAGLVAAPTAADILTGQKGVAATTTPGELGQGQAPPTAIGSMQDALAAHYQNVRDARDAVSGPLYDAAKGEASVPASEIPPWILRAPSMAPALGRATNIIGDMNANQGGRGRAPVQDIHDEQGNVVDQAYSPNTLITAKQVLANDAAKENASPAPLGASAKASTDASVGLTQWLHANIPGYAEADAAHAAMSPAVNVIRNEPDVIGAIARNKPIEQGGVGSFKQDANALLDKMAGSNAPGALVQKFIDAFGGNRQQVYQPIHDAIVGRLRGLDPGVPGAIRRDGSIDPVLFEKQIAPYMKTLAVHFPELNARFGNVRAAQATLDQLTAQQGIADKIRDGALLDAHGAATPASLDSFFRSQTGKDMQTHDPNGYMALQSLRERMARKGGGAPNSPLMRNVYGALPALAGAAAEHIPILSTIAGKDGPVLATIMAEHGPAMRQNTINRAHGAAITRAALDPAYRAELQALAAKKASKATIAEHFLKGLPGATRAGVYAGVGAAKP